MKCCTSILLPQRKFKGVKGADTGCCTSIRIRWPDAENQGARGVQGVYWYNIVVPVYSC